MGKTVTDPVSTISFKTLSVDSSGVTVQVREGIKPGTPGSFTAAATDAPRVDLSWAAASDNVAVAGYKVTRNGTSVGTIPASATSWTDTDVAFGTALHVHDRRRRHVREHRHGREQGRHHAGRPEPDPHADARPEREPHRHARPDADPGPDARPRPTSDPPTPDPRRRPIRRRRPPGDADAEPPTAPEPVTGTPTITTVSLSWGEATDDHAVAGYRVRRNGSLVATTSEATLAWKDTSRQPDTTYTYEVQAFDAAGNASVPSQVDVTTMADTTRPTTPENFRKSSRSGSYVVFRWSAAKRQRQGRALPRLPLRLQHAREEGPRDEGDDQDGLRRQVLRPGPGHLGQRELPHAPRARPIARRGRPPTRQPPRSAIDSTACRPKPTPSSRCSSCAPSSRASSPCGSRVASGDPAVLRRTSCRPLPGSPRSTSSATASACRSAPRSSCSGSRSPCWGTSRSGSGRRSPSRCSRP